MAQKKILFTTTYTKESKPIDLFSLGTKKTIFRFTFPRITSFGLRFIKQNIPQIEILEYPTWEEYTNKIKEGWDIVGFSFYLIDTPEAIEMIKYARDKGIKEIWGGNYGVLTDGIEKNFDKIFIGYAEQEIAKSLGIKIGHIVHPPLINYIGTPIGYKATRVGIIFSTRGCPLNCSFCQGPKFIEKPDIISIEEIDRVLRYYVNIGITEIAVADESFGLYKKHSEKVVNLLDKYNCNWTALTRVDLTTKYFDMWRQKGLSSALLGIESFNQKILNKINKKEVIEETIELVGKMNKMNLITMGYYIIGFEDDTVESIKRDIRELNKIDLFLSQVNVLAPLPKTEQWIEMDRKYGIFEKNYHKWDNKNLVFNHPHLTQKDIDYLLKWSHKLLYPKEKILKILKILIKRYSDSQGGILRGLLYLITQQFKANLHNFNIKKGVIFSNKSCSNDISVEPIYTRK